MKRWKKLALCAACVCCMGLLTGCGNDGNNAASKKETEKKARQTEQDSSGRTQADTDQTLDGKRDGALENGTAGETGREDLPAGRDEEDKAKENGTDTDVTDNPAGADNLGEGGNDGLGAGTDELGLDGTDGLDEDATDEGRRINSVTDEEGSALGGAAEDLIDGVGDAGKDLINGVEDAGDTLTGDGANANR